MVSDEEIFQTLIRWASTFGCDIIETDAEDFPGEKKARGFFHVNKRGPGMEEFAISFKSGLPLEEKVEVVAHEIGHLLFSLLGVPYQKESHEIVACIFGKSLIAALREDWENPFLLVHGTVGLIKQFLELLQAKKDRTSRTLARMEQEYFRWKAEHDKMAEGDGGSKFSDKGPC
jgi:hypothetical protein